MRLDCYLETRARVHQQHNAALSPSTDRPSAACSFRRRSFPCAPAKPRGAHTSAPQLGTTTQHKTTHNHPFDPSAAAVALAIPVSAYAFSQSAPPKRLTSTDRSVPGRTHHSVTATPVGLLRGR